ncbi:hypothetical protein GTO89_12135 [Heliobacterium gestii]|uniref:PhiEco32-like amidoligase-type 2 protein n=1 Tax=Heliomicrobium gestii TaxID=2699 RepID=A0A845LK69_HELGE|nr:hypothetical protein [Heliomicrobium gestii]MBM7867238.1 hypothetical protein [Heliomicrobium gestii]MZP43793.1 hypothetical protein [Heliomicrobium gestii]
MKIYIHHDPSSSMAELARRLAARDIDVSAGRHGPAEPVDWWIKWGAGRESQPAAAQRLFNVQAVTALTTDFDAVERVLRRNHLQALLGEDPSRWPLAVWPKEYQIYLWDSRVIAVQRKVLITQQLRDLLPNKSVTPSFHWVEQLTPWEEERLVSAAIRALHCLGLDFGRVHLGVNRSRGPIILAVDPAPIVRNRLAQAYADAITASVREWQERATVTIGSDPEFMLSLVPGRRMVPASRFFPRTGIVGCDNRRAFGASDDLPLAEVRPAPAENAAEALQQLRVVLHEANRLCPYGNIAWVAGSEPYPGYPTGGHIHFGGLQPNSRLIRALDQYLALPLLYLENPETAARRRQFYGALGDFRVKPHGFEYRTPGSWLASPETAWLALHLAAVVAQHYRRLERWDFLQPERQDDFYEGKRQALMPLLRQTLLELVSIDDSETMRRLAQRLWSMAEEGSYLPEDMDIRRAWKLPIGLHRYRYVPRPRYSISWLGGSASRI